MITIDIAQRAASRDRAPFIQFYRTEADRRPARRVAMPNDGPAPDRHERSEAARAAIQRKALTPPREPLLTKGQDFEAKVIVCMKALAADRNVLRDIAPELGLGIERTRDYCLTLVARGFAISRKERRGNCQYVAYYLTDAGRAQIAAG